MQSIVEPIGLAAAWLLIAGLNLLRYLIFAGTAYLIFYEIKNHPWQHLRIKPENPDRKRRLAELTNSLMTVSIFGTYGILVYFLEKAGYTLIYKEISEYGWVYFACSVVAMLLLHDTYFYWVHRLMHTHYLYKRVHRVHHLSHNPSPLAAFSFHPLEAILEAAIVLIIVFVMPTHPLAILIFSVLSLLGNIMGHLGYELAPRDFARDWFGKWQNTATHHNMHHSLVKCNYGLYFIFWDRWMGTNHQHYEQKFEEVTNRKKQDIF